MTIFKHFYFVLILSLGSVFAGNELFIQANRNLLSFHPSNVGSKGNDRLNLIFNTYNTDTQQNSDLSFSYDNFIKKINSGAGLYIMQSKNHNSWNSSTNNTIGFTFSPKFNVMSKSNHHKARYTIAPALFFEIGNHATTASKIYQQIIYSSTVYNSENQHGIEQAQDSSFLLTLSNRINDIHFSTGLGLQLIGEKFFLQANLPFISQSVHEQQLQGRSTTTQNSISTPTERHRQFYSSRLDLGAGYSWTLHKRKAIFLTSIIAMSYRYRWNAWKDEQSYQQLFYGEVYADERKNSIESIHVSTLFRFKTYLFGYAFTKYNSQSRNGLSLGYQHHKYKVLISTNIIKQVQFEIALSYNF